MQINGEINMHIFDTKKEEEWIELLTNFSKETFMASAVFDTENNLLIKSGKRNDFCLHIKNYSQGQASICSLAQSNIALIAKKQMAPVIDFCDANCVKAIIPCFVGNKYVGGITACGCRITDEPLNLEYISELTESTVEQLQNFSVELTAIEDLKPVVHKYHALINRKDTA
jgi:ligand-binding sensor protein